MDPREIFLNFGETNAKVDNDVIDFEGLSKAWQEADGTLFNVRIGPNYSKHGKKSPSLTQMYEVFGFETFRGEQRIFPASKIYNFPELPEHVKNFSHKHVPKVFVLNIQIPDCSPQMFGNTQDGQTAHLVIFSYIRQDAIDALTDPSQSYPGIRLFEEWCEQATKDDKFRGRFKAIGYVENFKTAGLPSLLEGYNGKPTLIKSTGTAARGKDNLYLEMSINVHMFPFYSRKIIQSYKVKNKHLIWRCATTIEGRSDEELPERVIFAVRVILSNAIEAPLISSKVYEMLSKESERLDHHVPIEIYGANA